VFTSQKEKVKIVWHKIKQHGTHQSTTTRRETNPQTRP
jgi:hypothetical protein